MPAQTDIRLSTRATALSAPSGPVAGALLRVAALLVLAAVQAVACSVPVFAYALRRWENDPHLLITPRDEAWRTQAQRRFESLHAAIAVVAPEQGLEPGIAWPDGSPWLPGEIAEDRLETLAVSPVRRELAARLAGGATVVWLHLRSGDAAADAAVGERLRRRLDYLRGVIELPALEVDPEDMATARTMAVTGPTPRLDFVVLDIDPADAREWALIAQMRAFANGASGPLLAPVYGRARMLDSQPVATWDERLIDGATGFLTGSCSCQVKEQNPGVDLLVACAWDEEMEKAAFAEAEAKPADTAPAAPTPPAAPERVVITPPAAPMAPVAPAAEPTRRSWLPWLLVTTPLIALLALVTRRRKG